MYGGAGVPVGVVVGVEVGVAVGVGVSVAVGLAEGVGVGFGVGVGVEVNGTTLKTPVVERISESIIPEPEYGDRSAVEEIIV